MSDKFSRFYEIQEESTRRGKEIKRLKTIIKDAQNQVDYICEPCMSECLKCNINGLKQLLSEVDDG